MVLSVKTAHFCHFITKFEKNHNIWRVWKKLKSEYISMLSIERTVIIVHIFISWNYLLCSKQFYYVILIFNFRSPKECVNDVLDLLCKTTSSEGYLTLAQGYLWRFIITREDLCKQVCSWPLFRLQLCLSFVKRNEWLNDTVNYSLQYVR